jgi:lipoate-protein ligase A
VFKKIGLEVYFSPRNDLMLEGKKISGNAQFTNRKNILSHGTLLVHADMDRLRLALRQNEFEVQTKAVSSVRSSVLNLSEVSEALPTVSELQLLLLRYLPIEHTCTIDAMQWEEIAKIREEKYAHRDWIYGRNPSTQIVKNQLIILVDHGRITSIHQGGAAVYLELSGVEYSSSGLRQAGVCSEDMEVLF